MSYTMSREKNIVCFQSDDKAKPYKFDVNTGMFYGLTGKPIKSCPTGFGKWVEENYRTNNIVYMMYTVRSNPQSYNMGWNIPTMDRLSEVAALFNIADKLGSIGYSFKSCDECRRDTLLDLDKTFKDFAKYIRENPNGSIREYQSVGAKDRWLRQHKLVADGHLTDEIINMLWDNRRMYAEDKTSLVAYYITHGLYDFFNIEPQSVRFSSSCGVSSMFEKIKQYFDLCDKMNVKPQKEDMLRSYVNLRRTYVMNRKELDMAALAAQYAKHPALAYENDTFKVVIPTTREDFLNEANAQQNCVYSYYLPDVIKGNTNVVFIRRKNTPDKSFITCEVGNNGNIRQYLGFANNRPTDADAVEFQREYADHLRKNW